MVDFDELINRRVVAIARSHGCTVDDVHDALDRHPIELDRDVASGVLMVKIAERRATLLGLNAPLGHAVHVVQHPPVHQPTSTDKIEAALNRLIEDGKRSKSNGHASPIE